MVGRGEDKSTAARGLKPRAGQANDYWGSEEQPFWRPGPNPTVDMIIKHQGRVLLIRRRGEPHKGSWALPGGFHDSNAFKGEPWRPGKESVHEAALRELKEETGLGGITKEQIRKVGVFDTFGRDPRDNKEAWSKSTAFLFELAADERPEVLAGDDADDAAWFLPQEIGELELAFDHLEILQKAGLFTKQ